LTPKTRNACYLPSAAGLRQNAGKPLIVLLDKPELGTSKGGI